MEEGLGWEEQIRTDVQRQLSLSDRLQMVVGGIVYSPSPVVSCEAI